MHKKLLLIAAAITLLIPAAVFASGFGYYEHGAKATGMAGAFVAQADDASAIFYNPAGIAFLEGTSIYAAGHPVKPNVTASYGGVETEADTPWIFPASAFVSHSLTDNISVGIGMFVPYGLEVKWPENWQGSALSQRSFLSSYYYRPTVAFKVSDNLAIGLSVDYVWSKLTLERQAPFSISPLLPSGYLDSTMEGHGKGWGFTASALLKVNENFQLGVKYQHEVEIEYEGDALFDYTASGHPLVDGTAAALFGSSLDVDTTITMPAEFVAGAMFKPAEDLTLEVDVQWTTWSNWDQLDIAFSNPVLDFSEEGNWDDIWIFRVGGQYQVNHSWAVRAGYIYDQNPIPAETLKPLLPDSDRNEISFGVGYDTKEACCWGKFQADFAIQYLMFDDRTSEYASYPAEYKDIDALIIGFGIGVTF